jgi:hypothetical protein
VLTTTTTTTAATTIQRYVGGLAVDFATSYRETTKDTGVFFILSPGVNPIAYVVSATLQITLILLISFTCSLTLLSLFTYSFFAFGFALLIHFTRYILSLVALASLA